ncbi:glycosyltransferase family 2 protein [Kaistella pullorum]|uniref:Glycosyltransferase family 2 protein n=1 Tax=Kaistella pullorum TaxID=2763074 RepID=A0ABR8WIZ8_9FLAO|nr:glycosyltransferase family 2 protein [Kaistella pullorum]MBD8017004.1 glycosyltransferase family 2 protein [Kaistella pullorum]
MSLYPKITVITITHCHAEYITETLSSVLLQEYPGEIEYIIANDRSPDNTDEIVKAFLASRQVPSNFKIFYTRHEENKGMSGNINWALQRAAGKYIAICEGDDYWTDPLKLRTQVEFLEENKEYALCFSNMNVLRNNVLERRKNLLSKTSFNKSETPFIHIPTPTALFRNFMKDLPPQLASSLIDASLWLFLSQYGSFYYSDNAPVVYRVHDGGAWSGSTDLVNFTRSTKVRIIAWKHLKNIDKIAVANVILNWINLKKTAEQNNRMIFAYCLSIYQRFYFISYLYIQKFKEKLDMLSKAPSSKKNMV